jgi:flavodoxin
MQHKATLQRRDAFKAALLPLAAGTALAPAPPTALAQGGAGSARRVVAFLSRSGNTRVLASALARRHGADLFEVRPRDPWPADYGQMVEWASRLRTSATDIPLAENLGRLDQYQTVFLGFPVWGTDLPAVMRSFLRSHALGGKTVVPFITYGSSGIGSSMQSVRRFAPNARFIDPFVLQCDQERTILDRLDSYLGSARIPP